MNLEQPRWFAFALGALFTLVPIAPLAQQLGDTSHWPMHLAGAVLLVAFATYSEYHHRSHGPIPLTVWAFLGILLLGFSSLFTSELAARSEAYYATGRYAGYAAAALIGWRAGQRGVPVLAWGLLGFGAMAVVFQFFQVFKVGGFTFGHNVATLKNLTGALANGMRIIYDDPYQATGILGHKNFTSSAIALTLPAAWFLWNRTQGNARKVAALTGMAVLITVIILRTRSIWIGIAIWAAFSIIRNFRSWKPLALSLLLGSLVLVGILANSKTREALRDPANLRIREVFWDHSIQMLQAHPLTGVGAGQWRIHFPSFGLTGMNPSVAEGVTAEVRPHNDALWLSAEHGWPGLLFWIGLWLSLGISWWRLRKYNGADFVAGISLIVFTYSNFEFPLERAAVFIPFALAVGMLRKDPEEIHQSKSWNLIALGSLFILILGYAYTAAQGISSEKDQQELLVHNANQSASKLLPAALETLDSWTELDRFGNPAPYFAGMSSMFLEAQRGPITTKSFTEAEAYFKQSLELHPHHVVTWYQLANLYRYRGEPQKAEEAYRELLKRSPFHPGGQMHIAHSLLAQNRPEEAAAKLFGAFGDDAYYQQPDYRNAAIQALRQCPDRVAMKGVQAVLNERASLDDNALFARFLAEKATWIGR